MKYLYLAGASGSIGTQTLDIVRSNPNLYKIIGISVGHDTAFAYKIIEEFKPEIVCFRYKEQIPNNISYEAYYGDEGLNILASYSKYPNEVFVNALVGIAGLAPTVNAIKAHKEIALANKETLVVAGDLIKALVKEYNVALIPIDSEHSAILQCLAGENKKEVKRLIITASGGSFRNKKREELIGVTKDQALNHPNWKMGAKITIDSATMMNKGFEVIEAHYLFDIPYENISTVLHPESIVHSLVEFNDGTIKAELGVSDMHTPIAYALNYPSHSIKSAKALDLLGLELHFDNLSDERFPCLKYAYMAASKGGVYLGVLNAANEAAVHLFLNDKIEFLDIEKIIYSEITNNEYDNEEYSLENLLLLAEKIKCKIFKKFGD